MSPPMVRIIIPLVVDEDGYPPFATERIWAREVRQGLFEVDNVPFYARHLALGDLVSADEVKGTLYFREVVEMSANSTVRFLFRDKSRIAPFEAGLTAIGCDGEWDRDRGLLAINVPSATHHRALMELIAACGGSDAIGYEEPALRFDEADLA